VPSRVERMRRCCGALGDADEGGEPHEMMGGGRG
jgi:hypothetical protein